MELVSGGKNSSSSSDDDEYSGTTGNDSVTAGLGDDTIWVFSGGNLINAGDSDDSLDGGDGADAFIFSNDKYGSDIIEDFDTDEGDTIILNGVTSQDDYTVTHDGTDTTIIFGSTSIIVNGVILSSDEIWEWQS